MGSPETLRLQLAERLGFSVRPPPTVRTIERTACDGHERHRLRYRVCDGDVVDAFFLRPHGAGPFPAVVAYHQHNSEWHLGKSEVAGLAGERLQAFGPALAARGVAVLAPDQLGFEERRAGARGTEVGPDDWLEYFNAMAYRLLRGQLLMAKVLADASAALSLLAARDDVDAGRLGAVGHSMGGNTVLFHAALDGRIRFACASGAACTFRTRTEHQTGIEMASVIPGLTRLCDVDDLARLAPRRTLLVSGEGDEFARDADAIATAAAVEHVRLGRGHALDAERFRLICEWLAAAA
jgi:dienelactone hydrolase